MFGLVRKDSLMWMKAETLHKVNVQKLNPPFIFVDLKKNLQLVKILKVQVGCRCADRRIHICV